MARRTGICRKLYHATTPARFESIRREGLAVGSEKLASDFANYSAAGLEETLNEVLEHHRPKKKFRRITRDAVYFWPSRRQAEFGASQLKETAVIEVDPRRIPRGRCAVGKESLSNRLFAELEQSDIGEEPDVDIAALARQYWKSARVYQPCEELAADEEVFCSTDIPPFAISRIFFT